MSCFFQASHVCKARSAHSRTAATLHALLINANEEVDPDGTLSLSDWALEQAKLYPTFKYWLTVLNLEVQYLAFVGSIRRGDFSGYKSALKRMIPLIFAFNHTNYSRWLPVHLFDLERLHHKAPEVLKNFESGKNNLH